MGKAVKSIAKIAAIGAVAYFGGGALAGSLVATGYSDYIILQASVTTAASAGAVNQKTFTLQYDEV